MDGGEVEVGWKEERGRVDGGKVGWRGCRGRVEGK